MDSYLRKRVRVTGSLSCGIGISLHPINLTVRKPLSHHEGDDTCASSYVQDVGATICPSSQKHRVSSHLHGATILTDGKPLECENIFCHFVTINPYYDNNAISPRLLRKHA